MSAETTPKCSIGAIVYKVSKIKHTITVIRCVNVVHHSLGHYSYHFDDKTRYLSRNFGDMLFLNQTDAARCLDRWNRITKKKMLLKEYETKLNKQLNITHHNFIK